MLEQLILNLVRASHGSPGNPVYRLASIEVRIVFHPRSARSVYSAKFAGILWVSLAEQPPSRGVISILTTDDPSRSDNSLVNQVDWMTEGRFRVR